MSVTGPAGEGAPSLSALRRMVATCDAFEEHWRRGEGPWIEDFLSGAAESERPALLRELVAIERELRRARGERPTAAEYRVRFPAFAAAVVAAFGEAGHPAARPEPRPAADRELLFGLLALQNNFVDREALLGAFNAWVADKARPLGRILLERGAVDEGRYALLETLVG